MTVSWFNSRKSAQIVAFFSNKEGDHISVLKVVKLIYLSDRKHMEAYGFPIVDDRFVSMPHGPVNSMTKNYLDGNFEDDAWAEFVGSSHNHNVQAHKHFDLDELDELSEAETEQLNAVWEEFGHMGKWEIRDWTHDNCPEWEDPQGSSNPIPHERVLKFLGHKEADALASEIIEERDVENIFASLR